MWTVLRAFVTSYIKPWCIILKLCAGNILIFLTHPMFKRSVSAVLAEIHLN